MFRIRIPRRVTLRKVHSIDHSISIETAQEDNSQVRKGGLPPLKLQFFDVSWVVMQLERGSTALPNCGLISLSGASDIEWLMLCTLNSVAAVLR